VERTKRRHSEMSKEARIAREKERMDQEEYFELTESLLYGPEIDD